MDLLLKEFKKFSRENSWVYILFLGALLLVVYSGKGNLIEITLLFIANFIANIFIMAMQNGFHQNNPQLATLYQIFGTIIFTLLAIYGLFYLGQSQYILWQIIYILAGLKTFFYFNKKMDIKIINEKLFIFLNTILLIIFYFYFADNNFAFMLQAIGFCFSSTGFVMLDEKKRHFTIFIGTWLIIIGSFLILYNSFISGKLDGIALGYFILSLSVGVYFLKILKKYFVLN